jgi:hypothetical protein
LCAAGFDRYVFARKYTKTNIERKPRSRYISRVHGGALIQVIAMEVCTFFKVTNFINLADFGGCMLKGFGFC